MRNSCCGMHHLQNTAGNKIICCDCPDLVKEAFPLGWKCPQCGKINAPHINSCDCYRTLEINYGKNTNTLF